MSGPRNKLWQAETIDDCGHESSTFLLARTREEALKKLQEMGELGTKWNYELVSLDTCLACSFAEVRGERGEIYYYRTRKIVEVGGVKVCAKHPRAVWHDSTQCPACTAEAEFIRLTDVPANGRN